MQVQERNSDDTSLIKDVCSLAYDCMKIPFLLLQFGAYCGLEVGAPVGAVSSIGYTIIFSDYNHFFSNLIKKVVLQFLQQQ